MRLPESAAATAPRHRRAKINATCPEPAYESGEPLPGECGQPPAKTLATAASPTIRSVAPTGDARSQSSEPEADTAIEPARRETDTSLRNSGVRRYEIYWASSPDKSASQYGVLAGLPVQLRHELSAPVRNRPLCQRPAPTPYPRFIHARGPALPGGKTQTDERVGLGFC